MNIFKRFISLLMLLCIWFLSTFNVSAYETKQVKLPLTWAITSKEVFKKVWVKHSKLVETTLPNEKKNFWLAWSTNSDLSHWAKQLEKSEYSKDWYIVLPKQWLIMPLWVLWSGHSIFKEYMKWKDKKLNELMTRWAVVVPISWYDLKFGNNWNKIIWWHSSYFKNKNLWKYKTHFQKIIGLEKDEEIWIYKNIAWTKEYQRYVYKVTKSYNIKSNDFEIVEDKKDRITLFTCTPIWWVTWRWIVEAEFVSQNKTK